MTSVRLSSYRLGLLVITLVLTHVGLGGLTALGQQGIFLTGLGESAQNRDVTEDGTNPPGSPANETAIVSITCCQPDGVTPITPMHGTEGEAVGNIINDLVFFDGTPPNLTKWNDLQGDEFMIPVEIQLDQPRAVNYYTLTSANDSPERDPWQWRLLGTNVANPTPADFVEIEMRTEVDFPLRHQTQLFGPLGNATEYQTYRFEFETQYVAQTPAGYPAGLPIPNSIQAAEVELFEDFAGGGARLTIDRGSTTTATTMTLSNAGTSSLSIIGYSITSAAGTLHSGNWQSMHNNYDGDSGGATPLDTDNWIRLTEADSRTDLSEVENANGTNGVTLAPAASIDLGSNVWIKFPMEDVSAEILLSDGTTQTVAVAYTGGAQYRFGDLNFDRNAALTVLDWNAFKLGHGFDFSTVVSAAESYAKGDLDGDFDHDLRDFQLFKTAYDAASGAGAFAAMLASVPEPSTALLFGGLALLFPFARPIRRCGTFLVLAGLTLALMSNQASQAQTMLPGLLGNDLTNPDDLGPADAMATAGAMSPAAETPPNSLDNNVNTKWLSFDPNGTFLDIRFNAGGRAAVNSYTLTSANDAPERDPYTWTLSGSNDGMNFTPVDTRTAFAFGARFETWQFSFTNTQPFNIYRFDFQTELGAGGPDPGTPDSIQLAEVEFFGEVAEPLLLTLQVNRETGAVTIANTVDAPISFDAYSIRSAAGALNRDAWWGTGATGGPNGGTSIHDQNLDGIGFPDSPGTGAGWEESPGSTNNELREYYLGPGGVGISTLNAAQSITMNNTFQSGGTEDLVFEYSSFGSIVQGLVEYVGTSGPLPGDFAGDGAVEGADLSLLLGNWGADIATVPASWDGDPPTAPFVDGDDLSRLLGNWGRTSGGGASVAAVPEPASWMLALVAPGLLLAVRRRAAGHIMERRQVLDDSQSILRRNAMADTPRNRSTSLLLALAAFGLLLAAPVAAATVDRNYQMGDDAQENATVGGTVGQSSVVANHTLDSASQGSFFDIMQNGGPTYVNPQTTGRPGATASSRGIQFTGTSSQYLTGAGFGSPREGGALASPAIMNYPNTRIMQIWARPTLDTGARQDIVNDTLQFGIHITANDTWGHTYGNTAGVGNVFDTGAPVEYNEWTHIQQRTFDNDGVAVYVNGVAVSRFNAGYAEATAPADNRNIYVGAGLGAGGNFFTGQLDELQIMVAGTFVPQPPNPPIPVQWGDFNLATENAYIATLGLVPGDANGDGAVNGDGTGPVGTDDVSFFVTHWLDERQVNGFVIGDLISRTEQADLNFDGRTTLADWAILRNAHAGGASLDLGALLAAVPEPSTVTLAILTGLALCGRVRRRQQAL